MRSETRVKTVTMHKALFIAAAALVVTLTNTATALDLITNQRNQKLGGDLSALS